MTIHTEPAVLRRAVRNYTERHTAFYDLAASDTPADVCRWAHNAGANVVMLVTDRLATLAELRDWLNTPGTPPGEHFLRAPNPVLRFDAGTGTVEVHRAAEWFGAGPYSSLDAALAWRILRAEVERAFDQGQLLATPATTGRYLLMRSIPYDREWPCLPGELQQLIRDTSGQGRIEVLERGAGTTPMIELDGRFMYAALVHELGAGVPELDTTDEYAGHRRGRYHVIATVPSDWHQRCTCGAPGHAGIGVLPHAGPERWEWPYQPGRRFECWADAVELGIALAHGWHVQIVERLLYPFPPYPEVVSRRGTRNKRGPLDAWADRLIEMRHRTGASTAGAELGMVATALRNVVLHTIGSLHGGGHRIQHKAALHDAGELVPADAIEVDRVGDQIVWFELAGAAWPEMSHPEWSSAIWARARARLLSGPGGTGALHIPANNVLAFRTDAIYVRADPGWPDDGRPGRFRPTLVWPHPVATPRTFAEIDALKGGA